MYLHRQSSRFMLILLLLPAALCAGLAWTSHTWWLYLLAVAFVLLAWVFSSLTIAVTDRELVSYFGPGVWSRHVTLGDIATAERTTSSPLEGWGIRFTPRGMLYNVAGTDAVDVRLATGQHFRLGTDDPDGLLAALHSVLHEDSR